MPHAPIDQNLSEKRIKKSLQNPPVSTGMFIVSCTTIFLRGILVHAEQKSCGDYIRNCTLPRKESLKNQSRKALS